MAAQRTRSTSPTTSRQGSPAKCPPRLALNQKQGWWLLIFIADIVVFDEEDADSTPPGLSVGFSGRD